MSCYGCICNHCLYNCELESYYFKPGEIERMEDVCYVCDECKWYDGNFLKGSQWRKSCEKFRLPAKYIEHQEYQKRVDAHRAEIRRKKFEVIRGGKDG